MLRCEGLSLSYGAGTGGRGGWVLRDVSLSVEPGQLLGVAGTSGSGKTTLLRCLAGELVAQEGDVSADGVTPDGTPDGRRALRERVGLVHQRPEEQLFAPTVADDVAFGPHNLGLPEEEVRGRVAWALGAVGLDEAAFGERSPFALSGGEQRRAALAGILALRPRYLLLDEPTAGLDPEQRDRLLDLLARLAGQGMGVVVVAHDLDALARACTHAALLAGGRIVRAGTAAEVLGDADAVRAAGLVPGVAVTVAEGLRAQGLDVPAGTLDAQGLARAVRTAQGGGHDSRDAEARTEPHAPASAASGGHVQPDGTTPAATGGRSGTSLGGRADGRKSVSSHLATAPDSTRVADAGTRAGHPTDASGSHASGGVRRPMSYGRYRPGTSLAYRLDPRTKLAFVLALVVASFAGGGWAMVAVLAVVAVGALAASAVRPAEALSQLRPFVWLMAFVLVFNSLFASAGLAEGALSVARFAVVVLGTSSLMVCTSPTELTDAASLLMRPLARLGVPSDDVALCVGMTLRFVPVVMEELDRVRRAQEGRFAHLGEGGLVGRVRSWVPVMVPVFASALRRSSRLALALDLRGYGLLPQGRRTSLRSYHLGPADAAVLVGSVALVVASFVL